MANVRAVRAPESAQEGSSSQQTSASFTDNQEINTSQESEKQRIEREAKVRVEKQNLEKKRVKKQIMEVCKHLNLGDSKDVEDILISATPNLCQLLKQLAALCELKLDSDTTEAPENFSCLLELLKAHRYGYCNITTCCDILTSLLEISGSPYSTPSQAQLLKELSDLWITKASYDNAITTATQLAKLANELGDKKLEGEAYYILIKPHVLKGSLEEGKLNLEKCVQCSAESGDELTIGYSKLATATIQYLEQNYEKALEEDEKFLEIAKRLNNKLAECEAILNMATIHCTLFNIQKSLNLFNEGLEMARELGHRKKVIETQANFASVYSLLGQYRKAYKLGEKIVKTLDTCEDKAYVYTVLCNLSVDALILNKDEKSLELAQKSLTVAEELDAGEPIALAYGNIGLAQEKLRDYDAAIKSYERCLEFGKKIKDTRIISNSYCNLGRAYEGKGDKEMARQYYHQALDMPEPPSSHWCDTEDFRFSADYLLAKMAVEENDFITAKKYFQQAVDRCEKFRKSVQDSPLKICFNDTQKKPFQYLQHVLLQEEAHAAALLVGEMGRGRDFYDKVIKEDHSKQLNTPEALVDLAKTNNQAVLFLSKLDVVQEMRTWFITPDGKITSFGQPLREWEEQLTDLRVVFSQKLIGNAQPDQLSSDDTTEMSIDVQPAQPSGTETTGNVPAAQPSSDNVTEIRGVDKKIFSDDESEDESEDEFDDVKSPFQKREGDSVQPTSCLNSASMRGPGACKPPETVSEAASASETAPEPAIPDFYNVLDNLSELIVRPIENLLENLVSENGPKPELLIIPQGQTFNIPYSTLRLKNGMPLCSLVSPREAFSFHSYSISTTLQKEAKSEVHQTTDILIVGNPTMDLPFAQQEALTIAQQLGVTPLMNESATRSEVLRRLSHAPIIHFACHGTIDGRSLLLASDSERGNIINYAELPRDSYLTVEDISNLTLQANLVVLSACHTARGKISSEGVLGLARAFLIAGAKSVVTALWAVNDSATEKFMLKFYNNLYMEPVVNALATTMCEMKREKFKVAQWGSFKVLGANIKVFSSSNV